MPEPVTVPVRVPVNVKLPCEGASRVPPDEITTLLNVTLPSLDAGFKSATPLA